MRRKLICCFLPVAAVMIFLALVIYKLQEMEASARLRAVQINIVSGGAAIIARCLDHLPEDIRFLSILEDVPSLVSAPSKKTLSRLETIFVAFLNASGEYTQARWIDVQGRERLRVDYSDNGTHFVAHDYLQNKSDRNYFTRAMNLPRNSIYISSVDLNVERGKVVVPHKPTVRVAAPIFDSVGNRHGLLILNQDMSGNLDLLAAVAQNHIINLVDEQGYWLKGEYSEDEWGNSLGHPERTLAVRYPEAWRHMLSQTAGQFEDADGLWTFRRIELLPGKLNKVEDGLIHFPMLTMLSRVPIEELAGLRRNLAIPTVALLVIALVGLFLIAATQAQALLSSIEAQYMVKAKAADLAHANAHLQETLRELHMTQDELIRSEKLSALGIMVAGVAHEINTPLGAALMAVSKIQVAGIELEQRFVQGLRRSELESYFKLQGEGLSLAIRSLERAARLVKSFKRLASDRVNEERRLFRLDAVVNECLMLCEDSAKRSLIEFEISIAPDIKLNSYPGSLSQVLHNLINNAVTHAFEHRAGGRINISAYAGSKPGILYIDVEDDGQGMSEDTLNRIFDPFYTTRRGRGGMGMGLHLSHQITTLVLGGTLNVTSSSEKGTRFSLCLPVQSPKLEQVESAVGS